MADERIYYVICADGCKFESMTKEQILAAITQAVETGEIKDVDTGFVTTIKEQNSGAGLTFWVGTSAEYNALETKATNCFYIITDDTYSDNINTAIEEMCKQLEIYGATAVVESTEHKGCYYRTVDGETEWVNPPMIADVEYRTAERNDNKPIYTTLISFYTADAGEIFQYNLDITDGETMPNIVEINGTLLKDEEAHPFPVITRSGSVAAHAYIDKYAGLLVSTLDSFAAGCLAKICIKYTKN